MTLKNTLAMVAVVALALPACGKKDKDKESKGTPTAAGKDTPAAPPAPKAIAPEAKPPAPEGPQRVTGFKTPESVFYDADADVYLVSNINGDPFATDDNGFISRVTPDGKSEVWIDGAKPDVTLNAPKGMAVLGDTLYVSDITVVRMFDRKSGAAKGEVAIKGTKFLNDMVAGKDAVYVSDTGADPGFKPGGTDAIYKIAGKKVTPVIKNKDLGGPNGITLVGDDLWVVTFGSGEVYSVKGGKKGAAVKPPKGQLDGLVALEGGDLLVSSWEGKAVYRGPAAGPFTEVAKDLESPADIGWDSKRNRLLVPLFMKDTVTFIDVK